MPIPIVLPSFQFASLREARAAVRAEVHPHRASGAIFSSELVAELLACRHYALAPHDYRPRLFRWGVHPEFNTADCFYAELAMFGWRKISFNKALHDWRLNDVTLDAELAEWYRRVILDHVFRHRDGQLTCQACGATPVDVHHVEPTFKQIAAQTTALLSPSERAQLIKSHDWFADAPWQLPQKCVDFIRKAHLNARVVSLCREHHHAAHKGSPP